MLKNYVLDTNILLSYPDSIYAFEDNNVIITSTVLQELDSKKSALGDLGYHAREACRILESFRLRGDLINGVPIERNGEVSGILYLSLSDSAPLPDYYSFDKPDNRIIAATKGIAKRTNIPTVLVTNDISMRINATVCKVEVQEYKNIRIEDEGYKGWTELEVTENIIDSLYANSSLSYSNSDLLDNEFVILKSGSKSALAIFHKGLLVRINTDKPSFRPYGIKTLNVAQKFAMYSLLAPVSDIPLVILNGPAGVGKTFEALAAGLSGTYAPRSEQLYNRLLITRANTQTEDRDFGYLPGGLQDKMRPLLAPFYDNLESLLRAGVREEQEQINTQIEDLFATGTIQLAPLAYIRGRSICDSFLICDEVQNVSQRMIKDIITRVGRGTKLVLMGDTSQIDNFTLDKHNNGLTYAINKMKGSSYCAIVQFDESDSVRSELSREALERM